MSKTDASKKSGKKKKLRKLAAQKLAHAAANNALNDIIAAAGAERGKSSAAGRPDRVTRRYAPPSPGVQQDASPLGNTYHRGPVILRGPMIPNDNTTANLLKPNQETDWLHMDPWRVLRIQSEFVDGFGGARRARAGGQRVRLRPHAAHRPRL